MPVYRITAHRLINHTAEVTAKSAKAAKEKYLRGVYNWEESDDKGLLDASLNAVEIDMNENDED